MDGPSVALLQSLLQQKDDEIKQLLHNIQRSEDQARWWKREAEEADEEVTNLRNQFNKRDRHSSCEASLMELRGIISGLETELAQSESCRKELEYSLKKKEQELECKRKAIPQVEESFNTTNNNTAEFEERIRILQEEMQLSVSEKMDIERVCVELRRNVQESEERTDDLIAETNALRRLLNDAQEQINALEGNVEGMQHNAHFAPQVNSLFGEFVDEQKPLEMDLKKLFGENRVLRHTKAKLQRKLNEAILQQRPPTATAVRDGVKKHGMCQNVGKRNKEQLKSLWKRLINKLTQICSMKA